MKTKLSKQVWDKVWNQDAYDYIAIKLSQAAQWYNRKTSTPLLGDQEVKARQYPNPPWPSHALWMEGMALLSLLSITATPSNHGVY